MAKVGGLTRMMINGKIKALSQLSKLVIDRNPLEKDDFIDLLQATFKSNSGLFTSELADEFGFGRTTIDRWVKGRSVPHPELRPKIIDWILLALNRRVGELRQDLA